MFRSEPCLHQVLLIPMFFLHTLSQLLLRSDVLAAAAVPNSKLCGARSCSWVRSNSSGCVTLWGWIPDLLFRVLIGCWKRGKRVNPIMCGRPQQGPCVIDSWCFRYVQYFKLDWTSRCRHRFDSLKTSHHTATYPHRFFATCRTNRQPYRHCEKALLHESIPSLLTICLWYYIYCCCYLLPALCCPSYTVNAVPI